MYWVYILRSEVRDYHYIGMTSDIAERLQRHNAGREATTRPYRPFRLLYSEACSDRNEARKREKYWKGGAGWRKIRNMQ
ncbi:GIY-YIG nuclease family protein [bacterium]|nr:GIY-YIG nuclease family protein [bacterium]